MYNIIYNICIIYTNILIGERTLLQSNLHSYFHCYYSPHLQEKQGSIKYTTRSLSNGYWKKVFTPHTTKFVGDLIERVLESRHNPNIKFQNPTSSLTLPQPDMPPNIAPLPKPSKETAQSIVQKPLLRPLHSTQLNLHLSHYCSGTTPSVPFYILQILDVYI